MGRCNFRKVSRELPSCWSQQQKEQPNCFEWGLSVRGDLEYSTPIRVGERIDVPIRPHTDVTNTLAEILEQSLFGNHLRSFECQSGQVGELQRADEEAIFP